jgi:hypothetical protein
MRLRTTFHRFFDNQNKESSLSNPPSFQLRNSPPLNPMKIETFSTAMRTATLTTSTVSKVETNLGWAAMSSFPEVVSAQEVSLGWDAMPAFGKADIASGDAELVANFVRTSRLAEAEPSALASFWSHMSLLCLKA